MLGFEKNKNRKCFPRVVRVIMAIVMTAFFMAGEITLLEKASGIPPDSLSKPQIWVSNPWIYFITSFVGGEELYVHSLFDWEGSSFCSEKTSLPSGSIIIALEKKEAEEIPMAYELQNLRCLFSEVPSLRGKTNPMHLDPPTMSLLGQKVLITLSSLFPEHYLYFQRNLAEFESRLESTVDMGRKMLRSVGIVNFSGSYALWIRAAAFQEIRPSQGKMPQLLKEEGHTLLMQTLETSLRKGHVVVTDESMPVEFQKIIEEQKNGIVLPLPHFKEPQGDFFLFLYEQYLNILNKYNKIHREVRLFLPLYKAIRQKEPGNFSENLFPGFIRKT